MKIFTKLSIIMAVLLVSSTACNEDFLEKAPIDRGSVEGFFETEEDVVRALNGVYDVFQGSIWGGGFYWMHQNFDILTDNGVGCCPWEQQYTTIAKGEHNPTTGGIINTKWDFGYEGIFRANSVLENVGNVGLDAATETAIIAEARFLRGLIYQELTNLFGDVPLILNVITREEGLSVSRAPKADVLAAIYADLDFAEANLDLTPFNGQVGRPTSQAAIAVKTRLRMYNGDFAGAITEARKAMQIAAANPGILGLLDDYENVVNPNSENNVEIMFDIQFTEGTQGEGNFMQVALAPGPEGGAGNGWGSITPLDGVVGAYKMTDGLDPEDSPLFDAANPYLNRDNRIYSNLFIPGVSTWRGETYTEAWSGFSPFFAIRKWVDLDATIGEGGCSCNETNLVLFRYADILLYFAEATNETSGPSPEAIDAVNQIRARGGLPAVDAGISQADFRQIIRDERHAEFAWEGTRYFDLIRWGIADEMVPQTTLFGESRDARVFQAPKHNLWPIPQKEIDQNANLTQNPGY